MITFIVGILLVLLFLGVPVAFSLAITGMAVLYYFDLASLDFIPQTMFSSLNSFTLLCIPFFIFAGNIMMKGELARYILDFMSGATRRIYGGKGIAITFTAALFGAITGSSVACTAAVGTVGYPFLEEEKYNSGFSQALIATVGALGIMIPPSLVFILIGAVTGVSIPQMFVAGVIPGLFETLIIAVFIYIVARKYKFGVRGNFNTFKEWIRSFGRAFYAILMPIIILGGIYSGLFTPTEAAAVAAVYALIVAAFVYKKMSWQDFNRILIESATSTAMVLIVVVGAMIFGYACTYARLPIIISESIAAAGLSAWQFLAVITVFFLFLGCFLDGISLVLITAPILYPILPSMGIDPIHFAVIICTLIEIAQITPPVGLNMFVMSAVAKSPIQVQMRWIPGFFIIRLISVLTIVYVPWLSLWLVKIIYS